MGFIRRIGRAIGRVAKGVARVTAGVATLGLSEVWLKGQKIRARGAQGRVGQRQMAQGFGRQFMQSPHCMQQHGCCAGYAAMAHAAQNSHQLAHLAQAGGQFGAFNNPMSAHNGMQMSAYYHAGLMRGRMQGFAMAHSVFG